MRAFAFGTSTRSLHPRTSSSRCKRACRTSFGMPSLQVRASTAATLDHGSAMTRHPHTP